MKVSLDFETFGTADLKRVGPRRYAEDARVLCMAYALEDEDPELWLPGDPLPEVFSDHLTEFHAWNAGFERAIWDGVCRRLYDWSGCPHPRHWVDTQARALLAGLPAALGKAAQVLGLPEDQQKDKRGKYLIQNLCKPLGKHRKPYSPEEREALLQELYEYCKRDVTVERTIGTALPPMPHREHRIWCLTEEMNETGVPVNLPASRGAVVYAGRAVAALNREASAASRGAFSSVSQVAKVLLWCEEQGVPLKNLQAATVDEALDGDLPTPVRLVLDVRRAAGLASAKKFKAITERVCADGRLRNTLRYHGAATGRWSSVGVQLQNLKRPELQPADVARWLGHLSRRQTVPGVSYLRGITLLGDCVRGAIQAEPGHILVASDYSQIEYRVLLWLARDEGHLQEVRDGLDPYVTMAAALYEVPAEQVVKSQRQAGKTAVLGCGYQSGPRGIQKFAEGYGLKFNNEEAQYVVDVYRAKYHRVKSLWYAVQEASVQAMDNPGEACRAGRLLFRCRKDQRWFEVMLPSGRKLRYFRPSVQWVERPWGQSRQVEYEGIDTYTRQWGRTSTYGGKLVENATQAVARDILALGMLRAKSYGLTPIMTVHDEIVCHEPWVDGAPALLEKLNRCLLKPQSWMAGLPLAVEGWVGHAYRK